MLSSLPPSSIFGRRALSSLSHTTMGSSWSAGISCSWTTAVIRAGREGESPSTLQSKEQPMADQNLDTVRGAYEAFGRGDVPGVLETLADDIAWEVPPPLPQAGGAHG